MGIVFNSSKIEEAIRKAAKSVGEEDQLIAASLTEQIVSDLERHLGPDEMPTVEQVQDCVEKTLIKNGKASIQMDKLRQWFRIWLDRQIEKSLQRQADRIFKRSLKKRQRYNR